MIATMVLVGLTAACNDKGGDNNGWTKVVREKKIVDNITYYFPAEVNVERREAAILESQNSIKENLQIIGEEDFSNEMDIEFVESRDQMLKYGGMRAQGMAFPERNTFFSLLKDDDSLIKHEMMHMMSMYKWGRPPQSSTWMNEGLATYAGGHCFDYTLEEIYKYFIQSGKLIATADLAKNFYRFPDMITYSQSAFISKYLIERHGIEKFTRLWREGFERMESVYGFDHITLETEMAEHINDMHPSDVDFDWELFDAGC